MLDQGVAEVETLADNPQLQVELYRVMGKSYVQLGDAQKGLDLLNTSVARFENEDPINPLALADVLLERAEAYRYLEQTDASIDDWRRVLALRAGVLPQDHPDISFATARLGATLGTQGRSSEALVLINKALAVKQRLGEEDAELLDVLGVMAVNLAQNGEYRKAREINERLIDLSIELLGERHPSTFIRIGNAGIHLHQDYRSEEGLKLLDRAISISKSVYPPDHPERSFDQRYRAQMLLRLGRFDEAAEALEAAAEITRAGEREGTMEWVHYLRGLGSLQLTRSDPKAAETFRASLQLAEQIGGPNASTTLISRIGLGTALAQKGDFMEAEHQLTLALKQRGRFQKSTEWRAERELASLFSQQGRFEEAAALFNNILVEQQAGTDYPAGAVLETLIDLAAHERRRGNFDEAVAMARRAGDIGRDILPEDNWITAQADAEAALARLENGEIAEALPLLQSAISRLRSTFGSGNPRVQELETRASKQ